MSIKNLHFDIFLLFLTLIFRYSGDIGEHEEKIGSSSGDDNSVKSPDGKRSGEKKMYHCQHCKYVTDRKNNLKRHVITMHDQCQKQLECCDVIFQNKVNHSTSILEFAILDVSQKSP